jgi:hypothetical protein
MHFSHRITQRKAFENVPISTSYMNADSLLASLWALSFSPIDPLFQSNKLNDFLRFAKQTLVKNRRTLSLLHEVQGKSDIKNIINNNGTALHSRILRSIDWLEENGREPLEYMHVSI